MLALDLFSAAAGGWSLGLHRAGFKTVAACEVIDWRRALYLQNNPGVRMYDDVRTLTGEQLLRDLGFLPTVVVGSPPCQDVSPANTKGKGVEGDQSKLFFEAVRIIGEVRPRWFALENSANLRTRGADAVLAALEALGYACWAFVVRAGDIGANHERPSPGSSDVTFPKLPTPVAGSSGSNQGGAAGRVGPVRHSTAHMIRHSLPTPMASDGMQDGRGGGSGSTYPFRMILSTPRASDMKAGGHGDTGRMGSVRHQLHQALETLPTPTKRDKRMDAWSPAYDKRKSPTMDAVMSGAMMSLTPTAKGNLTAPSMLKWAGARALAVILQSHGLTGTAALPVTYGWMMGYPPGWLARALQSAVRAGHLRQASSLKRSATP